MTHELRYQRDEHGLEVLDEVVAHGADLHPERMDADEWLLIARLADGSELRVTLWSEYTIEARAEVECVAVLTARECEAWLAERRTGDG